MSAQAPSPVQRLFVVGSGIMGAGIATVAIVRGVTVHLYDIKDTFLDKGVATVEKNLKRMVDKGILTQDARDKAANLMHPTLRYDPASDVDMVIEAAPENLATKKDIFRELDGIVPDTAILGTNTSSLSVTAIASAVRDPGRVVGTHFFNPVPAMELVELISGYHTRPEVLAKARLFAEFLGKKVSSSRDSPGFVTTRTVGILVNEAAFMLFERVASREDIDLAHKLGFNHPMGPLELGDLIGLDTVLAIMERLGTGFHDTKYRPCPLLVQMVEAGLLGRKTGEGFYKYNK